MKDVEETGALTELEREMKTYKRQVLGIQESKYVFRDGNHSFDDVTFFKSGRRSTMLEQALQ